LNGIGFSMAQIGGSVRAGAPESTGSKKMTEISAYGKATTLELPDPFETGDPPNAMLTM
jgi:hypothetical protein